MIAGIIILAGGLTILEFPVAQYPTTAPPAVTISGTTPALMPKQYRHGYTGYRTEYERYR
ncbi:hypothetical protein ACNKHK_02475 [Shigella flexneri]